LYGSKVVFEIGLCIKVHEYTLLNLIKGNLEILNLTIVFYLFTLLIIDSFNVGYTHHILNAVLELYPIDALLRYLEQILKSPLSSLQSYLLQLLMFDFLFQGMVVERMLNPLDELKALMLSLFR
jgi:hypothetical protein